MCQTYPNPSPQCPPAFYPPNNHQSRNPTRGRTKKCGDKPVCFFLNQNIRKNFGPTGGRTKIWSDRDSVVRQDRSLDRGGGTFPKSSDRKTIASDQGRGH